MAEPRSIGTSSEHWVHLPAPNGRVYESGKSLELSSGRYVREITSAVWDGHVIYFVGWRKE